MTTNKRADMLFDRAEQRLQVIAKLQVALEAIAKSSMDEEAVRVAYKALRETGLMA